MPLVDRNLTVFFLAISAAVPRAETPYGVREDGDSAAASDADAAPALPDRATSVSGAVTFVSRGVSRDQAEAAASIVLTEALGVSTSSLSLVVSEAPGVEVLYPAIFCTDHSIARRNASNCSGIRSGETCAVTCPSGYQADSATYVCHMDGSLHGSGPECSRIRCSSGIPAELDASSCLDVGVGQWCLVGCQPGYAATPSVYTCQESGIFTGVAPSCRRVQCLPDSISADFPVDASDCDGKLFGEACKVTCRSGYLGGERTMLCKSDARFESLDGRGALSCKALPCALPEYLHDTTVLHTCDSVRHNEVCTAWCASGFTGVSRQYKCNAPDLVGNAMSCVGKVCTMNIPSGHGVDASECMGTTTGKSCTPKCLAGYMASNSFKVTCGSDGSFTNSSLSCVRASCPDLSTVLEFADSSVVHTCSGLASGQSCSVHCGRGYDLEGSPLSLTCRMGVFVDASNKLASKPPTCIGRICTLNAPDRTGLSHDCANKSTGETCTVSAAVGYQYDAGGSPAPWTCGPDGAFSGTFPKVSALACGIASLGPGVASTCVSKAVGQYCWAYCVSPYTTISMGQYVCSVVGDILTYVAVSTGVSCSCTGLSCTRQLKSMPLAPRRSPGVCDPSAEAMGLTAQGISHDCLGKADGEACIAECADGFSITGGPSSVTCSGKHFVAKSLPSCTPRPCTAGFPSMIGVTHNCEGIRTGSSCLATCGVGYHSATGAVGETFTCTGSGELVGMSPHCTPTTCDPLVLPGTFRTTSCTGVATGQVCTVDCADGWTLQGSPAIYTCLATGAFSGSLPTCNPRFCTDSLAADARFNTIGCEHLKTGEMCNVSCATGYNGAPSTLTCDSSGVLLGQWPSCVSLVCLGSLPAVAGVVHDCHSIRFGQRCAVSCGIGYEPISGSPTQWWDCTWDRLLRAPVLSGSLPNCRPRRCTEGFPAGNNSVHNCTGITTGGHCTWSCAPGHEGSPSLLSCADSGVLVGSAPSCRAAACGARKLPGVADTCAGTVFGSSCSAACRAGYQGTVQRWTCDLAPDGRSPELRGPAPRCSPRPCRPDAVRGARYVHNCTGAVTGRSCIVSCADHYFGTPALFECRDTGRLEGVLPDCHLARDSSASPKTLPPPASGVASTQKTAASATLPAKPWAATAASRRLSSHPASSNQTSRFTLQYQVHLPVGHSPESEFAATALSNSSATFQTYLTDALVDAGADEKALSSLFVVESVSTPNRRILQGATICSDWCPDNYQCSQSMTFWTSAASRAQVEAASLRALGSFFGVAVNSFNISLYLEAGTVSPAVPTMCVYGIPAEYTGEPTGRVVTGCLERFSGEVCSITCGSGYEAQSAQYICHMDGHVRGSGPDCQRSSCTSGLPTGYNTSACDNTVTQSYCTVSCNSGFTGTPTVYHCQDDLVFSGTAPDCQRLSCSTHTLPTGLGVDTTACSGIYAGESCSATCATGYSGTSTTIECRDDGNFYGSAPSCTADTCNTPASFGDAQYSHSCGSVAHFDWCYVWCSEGYSGETAAQYCNSPNLVVSLPTCTGKACTLNFPYGDGIDASDCVGKTTGESCVPTCMQGYETTTSGSNVVCQASGSFSASSLACTQTACSDLSTDFQSAAIEHTCSGLVFGQTCSAYCAAGYELSGSPKSLECAMASSTVSTGGFVDLQGNLATTAPTCLGRTCTINIPNELGVDHDCNGKVFGQSCTASAGAGYTYAAGSSTVLTCGVDGAFAGQLPQVTASSCGSPSFGAGVSTTCSSNDLGTQCWAYCTPPYDWLWGTFQCSLVGNTPTYVQVTGDTMTCVCPEGVSCRRRLGDLLGLSRPRTGVCDASVAAAGLAAPGLRHDCLGKADDEVCIVECGYGYNISGYPSVYRCTGGKLIGNGLPSCTPAPCRFGVPSGLGVTHNCTGVGTGSSCMASCSRGYGHTTGSAQEVFTCMASGSFVGRNPSCEPLACRGFALPDEYRYNTCSGKVTGESCVVDCKDGWTLEGSPEVFQCLDTSEMHGKLPSCRPNLCKVGFPNASDLDTSACQGLRTGESCRLACAAGHEGAATALRCLPSGLLAGRRPECSPEVCQYSLPATPGFEHTCHEVPLGSSCRVTCSDGYGHALGTSSQEWTCNWNASAKSLQLHGTLPRCEPRPCRDVARLLAAPMLAHDCDGLVTGGTCVCGCAPGYHGVSSVLSCTADGTLLGRLPSCTSMVCGSPGIPGLVDTCEGTKFGEDCYVMCGLGYSGTPRRWRCLLAEDGATLGLQGEAPQCAALPCLAGPLDKAGLAHDCDGVTTGGSCTVRCAWPASGTPETFICQPSGAFAGKLPRCSRSSFAQSSARNASRRFELAPAGTEALPHLLRSLQQGSSSKWTLSYSACVSGAESATMTSFMDDIASDQRPLATVLIDELLTSGLDGLELASSFAIEAVGSLSCAAPLCTSTTTITSTSTATTTTATTTTATITDTTTTHTTTTATTTTSTITHTTTTATTLTLTTTTTTLDPNVDLTWPQLSLFYAKCLSCQSSGMDFCGQGRDCAPSGQCTSGCCTGDFCDYASPGDNCFNFVLSHLNTIHRCTLEPSCSCYLGGGPTTTTKTATTSTATTVTVTTTTTTTITTTTKGPINTILAFTTCLSCLAASQDFCGVTTACAAQGSCPSGGCTDAFCDYASPGGDSDTTVCMNFVTGDYPVVYNCAPEYVSMGCYLSGGPTTVTATTTTITTTTPPLFDCLLDYGNWEVAWSQVKKDYCCSFAGLGCPPTTTISSTTITITATTTTATTTTATTTSITLTTTTTSVTATSVTITTETSTLTTVTATTQTITTTTIKTPLEFSDILANQFVCLSCLSNGQDFCGTTKACAPAGTCLSFVCDSSYCDYVSPDGTSAYTLCQMFVLFKLNDIHMCYPEEPTLACYTAGGFTTTTTTFTLTTTTTVTIKAMTFSELIAAMTQCQVCLNGGDDYCGLTKACAPAGGQCTSGYCESDFCDYVTPDPSGSNSMRCYYFVVGNLNAIHVCAGDPQRSCYIPITTTRTTTEPPPFNCYQGQSNWELGWSDDKKAYCCDAIGFGCP